MSSKRGMLPSYEVYNYGEQMAREIILQTPLLSVDMYGVNHNSTFSSGILSLSHKQAQRLMEWKSYHICETSFRCSKCCEFRLRPLPFPVFIPRCPLTFGHEASDRKWFV